MWEERNATPSILALWLAAATVLKMLLLSSWQSSAGRYLSHMLYWTTPLLYAPFPYVGRNTRAEKLCFPCFQISKTNMHCKVKLWLLGCWSISTCASKVQSKTQEQQTYTVNMTRKKTVLLGIFNLLQCPFNLNMKSKKENGISSSALSLYGKTLDNLCYL